MWTLFTECNSTKNGGREVVQVSSKGSSWRAQTHMSHPMCGRYQHMRLSALFARFINQAIGGWKE
jgi:hypothetical protein